jgi:hypothetical protein
MGLDIRWPIGWMFLLLGVVLAGYGWLGNQAIYARSLGVNVNLIWGGVLAVFGLLMIVLARRGKGLQPNIQNGQNIQNDRDIPSH